MTDDLYERTVRLLLDAGCTEEQAQEWAEARVATQAAWPGLRTQPRVTDSDVLAWMPRYKRGRRNRRAS